VFCFRRKVRVIEVVNFLWRVGEERRGEVGVTGGEGKGRS